MPVLGGDDGHDLPVGDGAWRARVVVFFGIAAVEGPVVGCVVC